ncbi:MAG: hypothetical protein DRN05_04805 [Thermoplasmata archaeon]|nr:MAG: hypothetical protein DRN05_04805 [Thermoplasmata archaeon]
MKEDFFVITRLHKDDLRKLFKDNKKALEVIDELDEGEMQYIADKLANDYLEQLYWDSLKTIFEEFLEGR